jgi:hypothetical protein
MHIIHFNEMTVKVALQPNGEWTAVDHDNYDLDSPVGHGSTMLESIVDLRDQCIEKGLLLPLDRYN